MSHFGAGIWLIRAETQALMDLNARSSLFCVLTTVKCGATV